MKKSSKQYIVAMITFAAVMGGGTIIAQQPSQQTGQQALRAAAESALWEAYAGASGRIEIEVAHLDPRLQVPICRNSLYARANQPNPQGGRVTVRVECQDQAPWSRNVTANVRIFRQIVISSRALNRGTILGGHDLELQEQDISTHRGAVIEDIAQATGLSLRRNISAGNLVSLDMLVAPVLVSRGDTVVLTAERGGVAIRQQGTALQDGEAGKQIPVRNNGSNRVIQAVVTGPGEASVLF